MGCAFLVGFFFSLECIAGSTPGNTAPGSAVFIDVVSGELKRYSVYWRIDYVIESVRFQRGYGRL